jgi:hypothetical protein
MTKIISKRDKKQGKPLSGWDKAIADAEKGIERLKLAIDTFRENKATGQPWPVDASTQN